ncbi:SusD/RagB family nutrient-binding outer membrane lipoprotein [Gemmatimonas sp.]|uniref:SusD/RagB family nutrient-binding outer membrane lipoprotein n=1 Tax=Gemmatimonas sp. TaxID=1962908 RepID=UPI00286DEE98|nr:SusD/RagB family nutrient-binding outer membrane lipoprotein [Gemmatimonas sp.]
MRRPRVLLRGALLTGALVGVAGCQNFLDVNVNPNAPQEVEPNLYLPPILSSMATSEQFDGRFVGRYTQNWTLPSGAALPSVWDRMGYDIPPSDNGGQLWRDVYFVLGQNVVDLMRKAREAERWDLLGIGFTIKAWGWLKLTNMHGESIIQQSFDATRFAFDYDTEEYAYQEIFRNLDSAAVYLARTDGGVSSAYISRFDRVYSGDRVRWLRFASGLRAMALNHFSNKGTYRPQAVIDAVDNAFTGNADDALLPYSGTSADNADANFWGPRRGNLNSYRQTQFVLNLMNGTVFAGALDPRVSRMLAPSPDGTFRAWDPNSGTLALPAAQLPNNFFGYVGTAGAGQPSRYLFADRSRFPIMTYAQLQFIKAEAALRSGNRAVALDAYSRGVAAHIDFVNARNSDDAQAVAQITPAERSAYLANTAVVPTNPAQLTLSMVMSQKYIAQWAWAHVETWTDLRRYNYTGLDPATGRQVFPGFATPLVLFADNGNKIAQRVRARYNSEYVWNRPSLDKIGGLAPDFHTKPLWITQP